MTGEQMRWGLENLNLDRSAHEGARRCGHVPPLKTSCADHEGAGAVKFQQWDGKSWKWVRRHGRRSRAGAQDGRGSAAKYATEKNITPRDCGKRRLRSRRPA